MLPRWMHFLDNNSSLLESGTKRMFFSHFLMVLNVVIKIAFDVMLMIIHHCWNSGQKVSRCSCFNISPSPPKKTPISSKVVLLDPIMINNDHHHSFSNFVDHDHHLHHHWPSFQWWIFSIWLKSWFLKKSFSNTEPLGVDAFARQKMSFQGQLCVCEIWSILSDLIKSTCNLFRSWVRKFKVKTLDF